MMFSIPSDSSWPGVPPAAPTVGASFPSSPAYGTPRSSPPARPQLAQQPAPAPRIIRGQRPEEPASAVPAVPAVRPPSLRMPTPEELGVAEVKRSENPSIDWIAVHDQLDALGATCFHLERMPEGGCRITCLLPTRQQGRTHRIEAVAGSTADAVQLALAKVRQWAGER